MISVIITAFKEQKTIRKAVDAFLKQVGRKDEIIVTAPDKETIDAAGKIKDKRIKIMKDEGKGKPAALNLAVSKAKGEILILTDGDVYVSETAVKDIILKFDEKTGAVSGRPVSVNDRKNKYGYWAYLLTEVAHNRRRKALKMERRLFFSGYLFGIRKSLFPKLHEELLSEDGFVSHHVYVNRYKIDYADKAEVYVKYPDNFRDWIKQKKRSAGGYNQIKIADRVEIRSFRKESSGFMELFKYVKSFKEFIWLIELFIARIYLWGVIYRDVNLKKKSREEIWKRVESTK